MPGGEATVQFNPALGKAAWMSRLAGTRTGADGFACVRAGRFPFALGIWHAGVSR
jgi:hypothetical protein